MSKINRIKEALRKGESVCGHNKPDCTFKLDESSKTGLSITLLNGSIYPANYGDIKDAVIYE